MQYFLFVWTHYAGRAQMAQSLFDRYAAGDIRAESAGSDPTRRRSSGRTGRRDRRVRDHRARRADRGEAAAAPPPGR